MAKAKLNLPNGTQVEIEGTAEEVHKLLNLYSSTPGSTTQIKGSTKTETGKKKPINQVSESISNSDDVITNIVNKVKECDEAELIEENILDRSSQVDRTLLPLYIVHEYFDNSFGLQSGEISKITTQLGIRVTQPNASTTLSGSASRYVIGNKARKAKQAVKYKINRRGVKYLSAVIKGKSDE